MFGLWHSLRDAGSGWGGIPVWKLWEPSSHRVSILLFSLAVSETLKKWLHLCVFYSIWVCNGDDSNVVVYMVLVIS